MGGSVSTSIEDDFSDILSQMKSEGGSKSSKSSPEQKGRSSTRISQTMSNIGSMISSGSSPLHTCDKLMHQLHEGARINR